MMSFMFLLLVIAWIFFIASFFSNDTTILSLATIFLMALGLYIGFNGLDAINNFGTLALGIIMVGLGFYVLLKTNFALFGNLD